MVGFVNNDIYCFRENKNRVIKRFFLGEEVKEKISVVYKKCIN